MVKCPLYMNEIEILNRESAHEDVKLHAYCEKCDANVEVVCPTEKVARMMK
jgi:hypothetical protein